MSAKPAPSPFEVRRVTSPVPGYAVFSRDGGRCSGVVDSPDSAQERLTVLENRVRRASRLRRIPCLCCQTVFSSEGPHNRMCDPCRQTANAGALF